MNGSSGKLKVWCLLRDQFGHVKPVEEAMAGRAEFVYDGRWVPEELVRSAPNVVLCVNDFDHEVAACLEAAHEAHIPSLVLQDGSLEWRCQYENPLFGAGGGAPQHQPVLADKIACLGRQSARQIAAWGNPNKAEVTGMPRLDALMQRAVPPPARPGKRLLVMTAKKPGFTPEQTDITVHSLRDLKAVLETVPGLEVIWRLSKGLDATLGVSNRLTDLSGAELAVILENVDAVITTISTAILEAMLLDRPVAALDYHNVPRFVQTAWTISAPEHIAAVLAELRNPPPRKMAFQRDCIRDSLACAGPAAPRVASLIEAMAAEAAKIPSTAARWALPRRLLPDGEEMSIQKIPALGELYPEQSAFAESDVSVLQAKLARLQRRTTELEARLQKRTLRSGLYTLGKRVSSRLLKKK